MNLLILFSFIKVAKSIGLMPFGYNVDKGRFEESLVALCYSVAWIVILAVILPEGILFFLHYNSFFQLPIVVFTSHAGYVVLYFLVVSCMCLQLFHRRNQVSILNRIIDISEQLKTQSGDDATDKLDHFLAVVKIFNSVLQFVASVIFLAFRAPKVPFHSVIFVKFATTSILQVIVGVFFINLLLLRKMYQKVSTELKNALKYLLEVERIPKHRISRMEVISQVWAEVDAAVHLYFQMNRLVLDLNEAFQAQAISFMLHSIFHGCSLSFYIYYCVEPKSDRACFILSTILYLIVFIFSDFLDIFLFVFAMCALVEESQSPREILLYYFQTQYPDERVEQSIRDFVDRIACEDIQIMGMGLFTYNRNLALTIFVSIFSNVLILIQFEMSRHT